MLGAKRGERRYAVRAIVIVGVFVVSFGLYASGLARETAGVLFLPGYAGIVGVLVASLAGFRRDGLVVGWLLTWASFLGYYAFSSFFEERSGVSNELAYFLDPQLWAYSAVVAIVIALPAFLVGYGVQYGLRLLKRGPSSS